MHEGHINPVPNLVHLHSQPQIQTQIHQAYLSMLISDGESMDSLSIPASDSLTWMDSILAPIKTSSTLVTAITLH